MNDNSSAVRQRCGLVDVDQRAVLRVIGSDRLTFLQGMLSNDLASLIPGQGTYAALLTQQGKLVSDLRVYILDDEVWLDVPAGRAAAVREALERFIVADDVEFADAAEWQPLLSIEGAQAVRVALAVFGEALDAMPLHSHRLCRFETEPVRIVAATHTGARGFLVVGDAARTPALRARCLAAGAEAINAATLDLLRIEAGIPLFGRDMDEATLVSEGGRRDAISFSKGCYLGQEVGERVAARGQVQKKLVGLVYDGALVAEPGSKLLAADQEAGWITSAVWSPALNAVIALAYVRREHWEEGNTLQLEDGRDARVTALPFVGSILS